MSIAVSRPTDLSTALRLLADADASWSILGGGTDFMVELRTGRTRPGHVLDVWKLDELRGIEEREDGLVLGALETCTSVLASPLVARHAPLLQEAAAQVGAVQIQNRATLGGNLGTGSPAADLNPVLMALDARVRLVAEETERELSVAEFLTDYRTTARRANELIHSIVVPHPPDGTRTAFRKVGTRKAQSISKVVVAVALRIDPATREVAHVRAAAGSVAPQVVTLPSLPLTLVGQPMTSDTIARAARAAATRDVKPIDDVRSTAAYRTFVLERVLRTLLHELGDLPPWAETGLTAD